MNTVNDYIFVNNQEIHNGIYIANRIAAPKHVNIRHLNTTNFDQLVKVNKIQYENLKDYDIHNTNPKNRSEQVLSKL